MAEPLPLCGATPAEARETAVHDVLAPVAGWLVAHEAVQVVRLLVEDEIRVETSPAVSETALTAAFTAVLGIARPRWDRTEVARAFGDFRGAYATARPALKPRESWRSRVEIAVDAVIEDPPAPPQRLPSDSEVDAFHDELDALDQLEALHALLLEVLEATRKKVSPEIVARLEAHLLAMT